MPGKATYSLPHLAPPLRQAQDRLTKEGNEPHEMRLLQMQRERRWIPD